MAAKINLHQYVIFIKLLNFDTVAIMCFTVEQSSKQCRGKSYCFLRSRSTLSSLMQG